MILNSGLNLLEASNPDQKIWRYMDFTKFVDLLNSKKLYFTSPDKFEDIFEGTTSYKSYEFVRNRMGEQEVSNRASMSRTASMRHVRINCWHMNDYESLAMWKLYLKSNEGIAIQSTVGRLRNALELTPLACYLHPVSYVNYDTEPIGFDNFMKPYFYKRQAFEYEKELRAMVVEDFGSINPAINAGLKVDISLIELIEHVYVSPTSPAWLVSLVSDTCRKFESELIVMTSRLDETPPFQIRGL